MHRGLLADRCRDVPSAYGRRAAEITVIRPTIDTILTTLDHSGR
ncbi:hypothetical protein L810_6613 [Burkholderia sp. AU4i]|nr:hypothetical protein L810_6613 [Burkholderia sp. AU4i]